LTSLAATGAVAGVLVGSLVVAHQPAAASASADGTRLVAMPNTNLTAYSTKLSHRLKVDKAHAHQVRQRRKREARREARLRREREQRRQQQVAAQQPSGTPQEIAQTLVAQRGWDEAQFSCLVALWNRESGWNVYATNPSSGAYGIPQALPGSKMASAGPDWQTNPLTQIRWGLDYIAASYGTPCGALAHSNATGYY
jgi:hypothetical protein